MHTSFPVPLPRVTRAHTPPAMSLLFSLSPFASKGNPVFRRSARSCVGPCFGCRVLPRLAALAGIGLEGFERALVSSFPLTYLWYLGYRGPSERGGAASHVPTTEPSFGAIFACDCRSFLTFIALRASSSCCF